MITSILQILAGLAGVVATWAIMKFFLVPLFQKYQTWKDSIENNSASSGASSENQLNNNQDAKDAKTRDGVWDSLGPKDPQA